MISDEVASNRRRSAVSLASRRSYDENAAEAFPEISQLYRLREIGNRIAHEKAKRKSFCKYSQIRMIRIQLLGTNEKVPIAEKLKPVSDNGYACEVDKKFSDLRVRDAWERDNTEVDQQGNMDLVTNLTVPLERFDKEMGSIQIGKGMPSMQRDSWQGIGNESSPMNDSASRDTLHKSQNGKWALIANHFRLGHLSRRGTSKERKIICNASPLPQEGTLVSIKGDRKEGAQLDGISQGRLPRLIPAARGACPSFGIEGRASTVSTDATEERERNLERLASLKTSSDIQQVGFNDEYKRKQSLYKTKLTIKLPNNKNSISDNQQKKINLDVKAVSESRFSTCGKSKRRLSDEFKKLQSCRYLRFYKMK